MFDTHCHLNFKRLSTTVEDVIARAKQNGVNRILVPGTDMETSREAIALARSFAEVYAAVGIHPHHLYQLYKAGTTGRIPGLLGELETLAADERVLAIGEVGLDRHGYRITKYESYTVTEEFVLLQRQVLEKQMQLAKKRKKSLILHNWEAKADMLEVLRGSWDGYFSGRTVFHCCEPDDELLRFALEHSIFMGVDGDVTYSREKQEFVKKIPLALMVLETDAPYLLPEPLRSQKKYPNEPSYITYTADTVARLHGCPVGEIRTKTAANSCILFGLPENEGKDDGTDKSGRV